MSISSINFYQNNNNNMIAINSRSKQLHILIWNHITKRFSNIPVKYEPQQLKRIVEEEKISTKEVEIKMNRVVYSQATQNNNRILRLLKEYDERNYEAYNHNSLKNRSMNGLTTHSDDYTPDDYIWGGASLKTIEESPERFNGRYDQLSFQGLNYWRVQ